MKIKERLDYSSLIKEYPWLLEKNQKCIISPDADGMLCGLFLSHYLNWEIVGYYDNGKNLILKKGISSRDCIFVDTEIHRDDIKSVGHHISILRNKDDCLKGFSQCLNPNNLRKRSLKENFNKKYPMGTIHLILPIIAQKYEIKFSENAFFVILQADGTINRFLDKYSENLSDWLDYLGARDKGNILFKILDRNVHLLDLNKEYVDYVNEYVKNKKDKIPISDSKGLKTSSFNKLMNGFSIDCKKNIFDYLKFISEKTSWKFKETSWIFDDFKIYKFTKKIDKPGVKKYEQAVKDKFLSLAITGTQTMEYTLEQPDKLP